MPSHAHAARRSASLSLGSLPRFSGWPPATPASPTGPVGGPPGGDAAVENDSEESIEAVENLLESYFMQIDASYDRLVSIGATQAQPAPEPCRADGYTCARPASLVASCWLTPRATAWCPRCPIARLPWLGPPRARTSCWPRISLYDCLVSLSRPLPKPPAVMSQWALCEHKSSAESSQACMHDTWEKQLCLRTLFVRVQRRGQARVPRAGEYIKDTEEYINIELDSSRNRLIRLEIIITSATFGVAMFSLVAGAPRPRGPGQS